MTTVQDVVDVANEFWPPADAESWDACGLAIGDPAAPVSKILLAVDACNETVDEAIACGAQMLMTHHPLLLRPTPLLHAGTLKGTLISKLIRADVAQFAAHTNADAAAGGTNDTLAQGLGLINMAPLEPLDRDGTLGIGRVGELPHPWAFEDLLTRLTTIIPNTARGIAVAGSLERIVRTVAICTGAGDSFLEHPKVRTADVYITGDLRHHLAQDATATRAWGAPRPILVDVAHWASEWVWLPGAARRLAQRLPGVAVDVSTQNTDAWQTVVPGALMPDASATSIVNNEE